MIAKGTTHRDGAILARYLVTGKECESAELWDLRGFACTGIVAAFRSVHVMAAATKCVAPFFHVSVRNPEGDVLDRPQWEVVANSVERILGLTDQPRAIAFHTAEDTGHAHMHVAWSRIDEESLTAKPLPFWKHKLKNACRELEQRFGLTPVPNERLSSIRFAPTRSEQEQARRLGVDVHATRECIRNCFERSDCGKSFEAALSNRGLALARGDSRDFLVVDREGGIHALGKRVLGVSAAEIRHRLADLSRDYLPTLERARESIAAKKAVALDHKFSDGYSHAKDVPKPAGERKRTRSETAERKRRTVGKDLPRDQVRQHSVKAHSAVSLDYLTTDPLAPCGSLASEHAPTNQLRNESPDPAGDRVQNHELLHVITGPQEQTDSAFFPDASAGPEPDTEAFPQLEQPPPAQKPCVQTVRLRDRFRALVKQITASDPVPQAMSRKRRRDEMAGVFGKAALGMLRSVARIPPLHFLDPAWEPFTWLRLWDCNDLAGSDVHQDYRSSIIANHSSHL